MDNDRGEIIVSERSPKPPPLSFQSYQEPSPGGTTASGRAPAQKRYELIDGQWVQLTAAGVPRKKPGRKPGSTVKPKTTDGTEPAKVRKARKSRDPDAPPIQRKRKTAASDVEGDSDASKANPVPQTDASPHSHSFQHFGGSDQRSSPKMSKREGYPSSMQSILNTNPPATTSPSTISSAPVRSSGLSYDPIRGNYDPVRETIYSSNSGSPRGPTQTSANRSPSIASMLEPQGRTAASPGQSHQTHPATSAHSRLHESSSMPPSPSYRPSSVLASRQAAAADSQKESTATLAPRPVVNQANFTTIANGPIRKTSPKLKPTTGMSTPRTDTLDDPQDSEGRSILDFGKARPGEEFQAPTIVLNIPIKSGETNKYVNFMRLAEDRYGWDALHPRLAANRDRKARIAAATATLEKAEQRESGDEMSLDLSDGEGSNPENGGTSGPDVQAKPKKKRNFKEDQYDVDDEFVDDSELLWEAQAAASRDGFFVYSGPLVPEPEKPAV